MQEIFERWYNLQLKYPKVLQSNSANIIFTHIVSEYYKQGEESEIGFTKIYCSELLTKLGLSDGINLVGGDLSGEDYYLCLVLDILDILDKNGVLFYLLDPLIIRPFYTISFTTVIDGLMNFKYDVIKDKNEKRYK